MKFLFLSLFLLNAYADLPNWVSDSKKGCKKSELCAVGEGESSSGAARNARVALSKIFENQVSSKFSSNLSSSNGKVDDSASEQIEEITETALEGVQITKTAESKTSYFALASINKMKAASGFEREIKKLDEKMEILYEEKDPSLAVKIEQLFLQREVLNKRFAFLTGREVQSKIDFSKVFKNKREAMANIILHVYLDEEEPKYVEAAVAQELSSAGYKVTTGRVRNKSSTNIITGEVTSEKMHMNVEGFEKFKFTLKLTSSDLKNVQKGRLTFDTEETGRSYDQAVQKAVEKIKEYIKTNIKELTI
ncbi:LPP20 family lipoprotein [Bacteriovorax sp. Seq25_V]|uniref:LPP20 family lipoprotein n=1 Tax=Bacteriovorax sp. Seq25_V TaxID=1201288 RepID=UPI00038A4F2F|nr:LPP20 family lipoprotein [Bacteriovorax sp. Seq25_V]EQC46585.1 LPP20 lipoprotein [Bacteriovorax sp. Seq25_V]